MDAAERVLRCKCGRLAGALAPDGRYFRADCYCRDCQAYAHALGKAQEILDPLGGTNVVPTVQQYVTFTQGTDALACLSLSPRGLLRWYAGCCATAIANTTRDPKISYVGVMHTCLGDRAALDAVYGPTRMAVNAARVRDKVAHGKLAGIAPTGRLAAAVLRARLDGGWRRSPFFDSQSRPVAPARIISREEREKAYHAVDSRAPG